jgi:hypothetical protein
MPEQGVEFFLERSRMKYFTFLKQAVIFKECVPEGKAVNIEFSIIY